MKFKTTEVVYEEAMYHGADAPLCPKCADPASDCEPEPTTVPGADYELVCWSCQTVTPVRKGGARLCKK